MAELVNVNGREMPRHAVHFDDIAPLLRLAARNAVRNAEYVNLSGDDDPRRWLRRQINDLETLVREQTSFMYDVLDHCYGPAGHDWSRETDYCNRCGADGRA